MLIKKLQLRGRKRRREQRLIFPLFPSSSPSPSFFLLFSFYLYSAILGVSADKAFERHKTSRGGSGCSSKLAKILNTPAYITAPRREEESFRRLPPLPPSFFPLVVRIRERIRVVTALAPLCARISII